MEDNDNSTFFTGDDSSNVDGSGAPMTTNPPTMEFVSQDTVTLDITAGANEQVLDADPGLESLIEEANENSSDPIILLDQDQINRLETALQSAKDKGMLDDDNEPDAALVNFLKQETGQVDLDFAPEAADQAANDDHEEGDDANEDQGKSGRSAPKRRSQRQMEKEIKEEADRIRLENQALMKKEKEELEKKKGEGDEDLETKPVSTTSVASGRPKRERKVPAHLKSGDFESSFVQTTSKSPVKKTPAEVKSKVKDEAPEKKDDDEKDDSKEQVEDEEPEDEEDDQDSEADWNSEDDPDRLWCVCQQPHNNRFMICCDTCLDWFHGKCVGITKKMGKDMEEAGNEWRCPKCKEQEEDSKFHEKKAELDKKLKERQDYKRKKMSMLKRPRPSSISDQSLKKKEKTCMECSNKPQPESLYCSDECVKKHVEKALRRFAKTRKMKSGGTDKNSSPSSHPVMVMDPKANTTLNGPNAPTEANLESWLLKRPSFHVVMPTFHSTNSFYGKKKPMTSPQTKPKVMPKSSSFVDEALAEYKKSALSSLEAAKSHLMQKEESKTKARSQHHHASPSKPHQRRESGHAKPSPVSSSSASASKPSSSPNTKGIRENAVKALAEALRIRVDKADEVTATPDKLKDLAKAIEEQMFKLYNKDVGPKYKNKYRSLLFNIKDEKNNGLFRKIVNEKISAKSLVSMTAEEMASKELQQWRQEKLKHDIEKIKTFELDQLARGNQVVVKSHKGEQIIESDDIKKAKISEVKLPEDLAKEAKKEKEKERHKKRYKDDKDRHHHRHHSSSSRHKSSKHHSKDKDKHRKSSHHRASSSDKKAEVKAEDKVEDKATPTKSDKDKEEEFRQKSFSEKVAKAEKMLSEFQKTMKEQKSIEIHEVDDLDEEDEVNEVPMEIDGVDKAVEQAVAQVEAAEEVSSTVQIKTPESIGDTSKSDPIVWKGDVDMPDVARFSVSAHGVSGTTDYLTVDLSSSLKIVGRIAPATVWEYLAQVAEVNTKEILVLQLKPSTSDEKDKYNAFYEYLTKRSRFGVVGNASKMVKDCYIFPLSSGDEIHPCLTPMDGPGLDEDRSDMLLALIVRSRRKRPADYERKYQEYVKAKAKAKEGGKKPSQAAEADIDDYDPSQAGQGLGEEEDEEYNPEKVAFDQEPPAKKAKAEVVGTADNPTFSPPPDDLDPIPGLDGKIAPITSGEGGGFTEQLAKLTKEIEKQKAEIASLASTEDATSAAKAGPEAVKGFQGLPSGIASILFGNTDNSNSEATKSSSGLSAMSDADILAKVQEMEGGSGASKTTPPDVPPMFPPQRPPMYPGSLGMPPFPPSGPGGQFGGPSTSSSSWPGPAPWAERGAPPLPRGPWQENQRHDRRDWNQRGPGGHWRDGHGRDRDRHHRRDHRRGRSPDRRGRRRSNH